MQEILLMLMLEQTEGRDSRPDHIGGSGKEGYGGGCHGSCIDDRLRPQPCQLHSRSANTAAHTSVLFRSVPDCMGSRQQN